MSGSQGKSEAATGQRDYVKEAALMEKHRYETSILCCVMRQRRGDKNSVYLLKRLILQGFQSLLSPIYYIDRMLRGRRFGPARKSGHPKARINFLLSMEKSFGIKTQSSSFLPARRLRRSLTDRRDIVKILLYILRIFFKNSLNL